ncbi:hypothetical protein [Plasmodium yoelii yoelii]|uniref:Uncharacterized protein n=1 Tax=Plasmodium yoelii yoelii TaxID=73239 RepID=Q7RAY5_PLAYO|nr:hypothetical protein [Plasmodium yoelii yoelii]
MFARPRHTLTRDSYIRCLHGPSFYLNSKLCLCNSFQGCFAPTSKEGHSVHTSVFIFLEFHVFRKLYLISWVS